MQYVGDLASIRSLESLRDMALEASTAQPWELQRLALTSLANVWLAEGASAVTITIHGIPVVSLSADKLLPADKLLSADKLSLSARPRASVASGQPHLAAPIQWGGELAGEIRITGAIGEATSAGDGFRKIAQARVAAEAQLVGLLLETQADLASMTDQLIQTQDQLLAVYDLGQLARRPMRLAERLLALAEAAGRLLGVEGTAVVLASDGQGPVAAQYPPEAQDEAWLLTLLPFLPPADRPSIDGSFPGRAVLWQGRRRSDRVQPPALPGKISSLLMVPIGAGGHLRGAFVFWSDKHERFASPDVKLAHAIAEHAAVQIENALLQRDRIAQTRLETEMQLARRVQTNLLPRALPKLPGLDVYACMRPASHVGGDFFDFVADSADSTVFLVSDVSGKGMSAALVMTMTRTILRSVIAQAKRTSGVGALMSAALPEAMLPAASLSRPAALLALVNDELFQDLTELSMFATTFVAQYHHSGRRLLYANAGHSPVIYMPAGSPPHLLEASCPPIGVMPTLRYDERALTLGPGDLLVAASDGFNEAHNAAGEMFGLDRLLRCVGESSDLSAQDLGQTLFAAVEAFRDGEMQEDDQTLVIAKGA
jgi:phosphoserine phosphatase RsbU/P